MPDLIILLVVAGIAIAAAVTLLALPDPASHDGLDVAPEAHGATHWLTAAAPRPLRRVIEAADRRMKQGAVLVVAFAALFVTTVIVGWIFTGISDERGVARWDSAAAEFGRDEATDTSTRALDLLTDLGAALPLFTLMALIGVYHSVKRSDTGPLIYLIVVGVGVALITNGLKLLVDRHRPDVAPLADFAGSSFPSGHTATAAACWAAIALVLARRRSTRVRRLAAAAAIVVAMVVAATRVLLGVHWLSDVVAGLFIGWGWWSVTSVIVGRSLGFGDTVHAARPAPLADDAVRNESPAPAPHETSHR